tara:strand:- start:27555 stop:28208 length:654 start_codon:yes stop_codon:yes gene_type:complete
VTDWHWQHSSDCFSLQWSQPRPCLSSAVFNGGLCKARSVLNLRVSGDPVSPLLTPEQSLHQAANRLDLPGPTIGLMTSALMASFRYRQTEYADHAIAIFLTCGLGNARRAGDPADWLGDSPTPLGTINSVLISDLQWSTASQAELLALLAEAKAAALQEMGIRSPLSGKPATGTGTDASVIIGGHGRAERWCGKHTKLGEIIAQLYMDALCSSIRED